MSKIIFEGITLEEFEAMLGRVVDERLANIQRANPNRLLDYKQVEQEFGFKRKKLYDLHNAGALFYVKDGRSTRWRYSDLVSRSNQLKSAG
jgi:predicted DNA-binding transcriptional regulator AlpA